MGIEDLIKDVAIGVGKKLIELGIRELSEVLNADEVRETVEQILPAESKSRKAQREIEEAAAELQRVGSGG